MESTRKRSKTVRININSKRLGELLKQKGYSVADACWEIGGDDYWLSLRDAVASGRLGVKFVDLIRDKFGIEPEEYVAGEMPAEEKPDQPFPPPPRIPMPPTPPPEPEREDPCDGLEGTIHDAVAKLLAVGVEAGTRKNSELIAETILTNARMVERTLPGVAIDYDRLAVSMFWAIDAAIWSITGKYTTGNPVVREIMNMKEAMK